MSHQEIAITTLEFATLSSLEATVEAVILAFVQTSCHRPKEETRPKEQRAMKVV